MYARLIALLLAHLYECTGRRAVALPRALALAFTLAAGLVLPAEVLVSVKVLRLRILCIGQAADKPANLYADRFTGCLKKNMDLF